MKKIQFLALSLGVLSLGLFTSCGETVEDPIGPSVEWIGSTGADIEKTQGDLLSVKFQVKEGDASIESVVAYFVTAGVKETILNTDADSAKPEDGSEYTLTRTLSNTGTFQLIINVTDKDALVGGDTIDIIVTAGAVALTDLGSSTVGAQTNETIGSYYSVSENTVYLQAAAYANKEKVDIVYYYGGTNLATIAAPDDVTVDGSTANSFDLTTGWEVKNATRFAAYSGNFDTATDSDIASISCTESKMTDLAVGDVIAFKTSANATGLIKVTNITVSGTGSTVISVKVK